MVLAIGVTVGVTAVAVFIGITIFFAVAGDGPDACACDIDGSANDGTTDFNGG